MQRTIAHTCIAHRTALYLCAVALPLLALLPSCMACPTCTLAAAQKPDKPDYTPLALLLGAGGTTSSPCRSLLTNSTGQTEDMSGWNIVYDTGIGWIASGNGSIPHFFATDYTFGLKDQEIDLLASGYTSAQLDELPSVYFGEIFTDPNPYGSWGYLTVELRDSSHSVLAQQSFGTAPANSGIICTSGSCAAGFYVNPSASYQATYTFSGYPAGVRYIYWADGGSDNTNWSGYYGSYLHEAYLLIGSGCSVPY